MLDHSEERGLFLGCWNSCGPSHCFVDDSIGALANLFLLLIVLGHVARCVGGATGGYKESKSGWETERERERERKYGKRVKAKSMRWIRIQITKKKGDPRDKEAKTREDNKGGKQKGHT